MTQLAYRATAMHDHPTLIHDLIEELRPDLPADFQFGVVQDTWEDITMTEFQTHGQTAGSWVSFDATPAEVTRTVTRDLRAFLTNPEYFSEPLLDVQQGWPSELESVEKIPVLS